MKLVPFFLHNKIMCMYVCMFTLLLGNSTTAAGKWGDYNCDMPYWTLENLMQFLSNRSDEVGFHSN